jgi:hypothetical protein
MRSQIIGGFGFLPRSFHDLIDGRELIHSGIETVDLAPNKRSFFFV